MLKIHTDLGWLRVQLDADGMARAYRGNLLMHKATTLDGMNRWLRLHKGKTIHVPTDKPQTKAKQAPHAGGTHIAPERLAEMALPGWDERGWHGGGEQVIRRTQRGTPRKGNTREGRYAHRIERTW